MDRPVYHFGKFQLSPDERSLKKSGVLVPLPPKAMDALLCFVVKSERLVSKRELVESLWPDTFVGDTNLTNIIVALRKVLGRNAIQTVSKHGYRFTLPLQAVPSPESRNIQERFARAKELAAQRSMESIESARNLLWICIAEDPSFAPAWAWLGRCCWQLVKLSDWPSRGAELASSAFDRAFALDPHLAIAHQFYIFSNRSRSCARCNDAAFSRGSPIARKSQRRCRVWCRCFDAAVCSMNRSK